MWHCPAKFRQHPGQRDAGEGCGGVRMKSKCWVILVETDTAHAKQQPIAPSVGEAVVSVCVCVC